MTGTLALLEHFDRRRTPLAVEYAHLAQSGDRLQGGQKNTILPLAPKFPRDEDIHSSLSVPWAQTTSPGAQALD
jgi:hypothetical protein